MVTFSLTATTMANVVHGQHDAFFFAFPPEDVLPIVQAAKEEKHVECLEALVAALPLLTSWEAFLQAAVDFFQTVEDRFDAHRCLPPTGCLRPCFQHLLDSCKLVGSSFPPPSSCAELTCCCFSMMALRSTCSTESSVKPHHLLRPGKRGR